LRAQVYIIPLFILEQKEQMEFFYMLVRALSTSASL